MKKSLVAIVCMPLLGYVQIATADEGVGEKPVPNVPTHVAAKIQEQLEAQYPLARTTPDGADIVAAGAVLVLQRDNLVMNKVYMSGNHRSSPVDNMYANGKITQVGLMAGLSSLNSFLSALGGTEAQSKVFGRGERLWVTNISALSDGIVFRLMSDPVRNMRYHGTLKFPYASGSAPEQTAVLVAEALVTDPPVATGDASAQKTALQDASSAGPAPRDESEELRRAAAAGDVNAMFSLGNMVAQNGNDVEAAKWFRAASEQGHVKATNALGFMYEEGRGVPQNFSQASSLYLQAMKKADADAMVNRGLMFAQGRGVEPDHLQAYMHFLLSAAYAPDKETRDAAVKLRDEIAAKLPKLQISRGQAMADKFARDEIKQ